jgi:hypothetical protein
MQRCGITGSIKSLPERMFGIRHEIRHLDPHLVSLIRVVRADLGADPATGRVKGSAADGAKLVSHLKAQTASTKDCSEIRTYLIRTGGTDWHQ